MSRKLQWVILLTFICQLQHATGQVLPSFGDSRTGTTGLQFLKITPDARSAGLSNSTAASATDLSSLYWNAACLTKTDSNHFHFQIGHTGWFAGINLNSIAASYTADHLNYWGLSLVYLNSGEMPVTTEFEPYGNGQTFYSGDLMAGLTFAKVLSDNFSFGVSGKYVYEYVGDVKIHNGLFDLGLLYSIGYKQKTRFSVGISNFGFNVSPSGHVSVTTLKGDKVYNGFEDLSVPSVFRLAIATTLYEKGLHRFLLSGQLSHPTDNNEKVGIGLEYMFRHLLMLRTGYELGADLGSWPSLGIGLKLQRYFGNASLDYSFNSMEILGNVNRITIAFSLR